MKNSHAAALLSDCKRPTAIPVALAGGIAFLALASGCGSASPDNGATDESSSSSSSAGIDTSGLSSQDRELYDVLSKLVEANNATDEKASNNLVCSSVPRVNKSSLEAQLAADGKVRITDFRDVRFDSPTGASANVKVEMENDTSPKPGAYPLPPQLTPYYFAKEAGSWKVCSKPSM